MTSIPTIELGFTASYSNIIGGYRDAYITPSIRFLDKEGKFSKCSRALARAKANETRALKESFTRHRLNRWLWKRLHSKTMRHRLQVVEHIRKRTIDLLLHDYQAIELELAWPSKSSDFEPLITPGRVGEVADCLLQAEDIWLRVVEAK